MMDKKKEKEQVTQEDEQEPHEVIEINGKRMRVVTLELPVSGDTIKLRDVGLLTARKVEVVAGLADSNDPKLFVLGPITDAFEELRKEFINNKYIIEPKDFNPAKYDDDDLFDIIWTMYRRAQRHTGTVGGERAKKFLGGPKGASGGDDSAPDKPDGA